MRAIPVFAAFLMLATGVAVAQSDKDKEPGGNVPLAQGPCSAGYDNVVINGRMQRLSSEDMRTIDINGDGRISRTEFDSACANKLFKEQDSKS